MSCFVMNPRAVAALARGLETILNSGYNFAGFETPAELAEALEGCRDKYGFFQEKPIYSALYELNVKAFSGRYGGRYDDEIDPVPDFPQDVPRLLTKPGYIGYWAPGAGFWQYLKLIDCYLYQVSEDATYTAPLRVALSAFASILAGYLARNCAAYDNANWGCL